MSRYSSSKGGGGGFKPSLGIHNVVCCQIIDFGTTDKEWEGKIDGKVNKINLGFEFVDIDRESESGETYHPVWGIRETNSIGKKANLRKLLEGWRGKAFTSEEEAKFDLNVLLGLSCALVVGPNSKGNPKVTAISKVAKKFTGLREIKAFWIDKDWDKSIPEWLPEWMQEEIAKCDEAFEQEEPGTYQPTEPVAEVEDDDDIPF